MKPAVFYTLCLCLFYLHYTVGEVITRLPKRNTTKDYMRQKEIDMHRRFVIKLRSVVEGIDIEDIPPDPAITGDYQKMFKLFHVLYLLNNNELYRVHLNGVTVTNVTRVDSFNLLGDVHFVRTIEYKDIGFILVKSEIEIDVYKVIKNRVQFHHSIFAPRTSDAMLYINEGELFLLVINNREDTLGKSQIFKYTGTYFDEIQIVYTAGVFQVTSFTDNFVEIIIILQNFQRSGMISSVYQFKFGKLKKIQQLMTTEPKHIHIYKQKDETYVVVSEKSKNNLIYVWDRTTAKLVHISNFQTDTIVNKILTFTTNNTSLLIIPAKNKIQIFRIISKKIMLLGEKTTNYTTILDIYQNNNNDSILYVVGQGQNNTRYSISALSFKTNLSDPVTHKNKYTLRDCFNNLELGLFKQTKRLKEIQGILSQVNLDEMKNSINKTTRAVSGEMKEESNVTNELINLRTKLNLVRGLLEKYNETNVKDIIINNKTIIKGSVEAEKLTGKNVDVKKINDQNWEPENWLRYKQKQHIIGPITIAKVTSTELNSQASDPLFKDLLTKNGDQDIWGPFKIANLTVNKIKTEKINDILIKDLYLKNDPLPIDGLKTFDNFDVTKAEIRHLNGQSLDKLSPRNIIFDDNLEVENLIVDTIDNIHWDTFRNGVFRIGVTKEINGDLIFSDFKSNNLTLKSLKGVKVEDLLTTSTDQFINADIEFDTIFANNIRANTTNGIKLSKHAVQLENNTLVEGPVKFDKLFVKNLELVGELDNDFFSNDQEHIIGTNESDLWQKYEGTVKIKGNLYLKNLNIQTNAKLLISDEDFDSNMRGIYWTKNTTQTIPVHFEAQDGLTTSHLIINKLNDVNFNQYMLNKDGNKFESMYHFENISVMGDVFLNSRTNNTPNLTRLNEEAVKTTGSFYIRGKKTYTDVLRVENLVTPMLDKVVVNESLSTKSNLNTAGKKTFKKIIVKGNLSCNMHSLQFINDINISHLLKTTIFIDEPKNLQKLHFKNITVENLFVSKLNNNDVHQHIQNVDKILASNEINSLSINGKVTLKNVVHLSKINEIQFENLLNNTWKKGKYGGYLIDLEFKEPVVVHNLVTRFINDVDLRKLTKRLLYRKITDAQNITALYTFDSIKTENLVVSKINNISMENLIDVSSKSPQSIYAGNNLEFSSPVFQKSLKTNETSPCNLTEALRNFKNPGARNWNKVEVKGNVTFGDPENILYRVFENAVTTNSKNVITAPVTFSKHVAAENVFAKKHINGVNMVEIINDAILKQTDEEQLITGRKVFPTMAVLKAMVLRNTDTPVVNKIDIPVLDKVIVRKNDAQNYAIEGTKTFLGGLKCNNFYTKKISNIDVENIVSFDKPRKIPQTAFNSIEIENSLNISHVNHHDFDYFLANRLLTKGLEEQSVSGLYYFDSLQAEHILTPSINKIEMDNVVFDMGQQNISSSKQFVETVEVFGNITCQYINGIDISEMYEKSIATHDVTLEGSVTVAKRAFLNGNITTQYINGYPIDEIKRILDQGTIRTETKNVYNIHKTIVDKIKLNMNHIQFLASDYMYIEKTQALQIPISNTVNAKAMNSNGYVLMHVNGEESGEYCDLQNDCKCPVQYTIEISPGHSVSTFLNKEVQRIFTYRDDDIIAQFSTNSISTDSTCRRDQAKVLNETSMLSWNALPTANSTGGFYTFDQIITGYISGVEFFTLHQQTYAIIGRYYDSVNNTHDLDCYLMRFTHNKTKAEIIQKIPTKGAFSVYLFHTAQGITLIIGNIKPRTIHQTDEETRIYRFSESTRQFDLLRIVPTYGCSMATGVVLGTDSLIVLAHRYAPLQVLKYYPDYDNYYFYQSFELEAPAVGISVFYTGGFGVSDAYLCTVAENERYFIYSFRYIEGWTLESSGELDGLKNLVPFSLNKQSYLFAPSSKISSLLTVVKHGSV